MHVIIKIDRLSFLYMYEFFNRVFPGHALGLFHSTAEGALMNPYYDDKSKMELSADDILGIQTLCM